MELVIRKSEYHPVLMGHSYVLYVNGVEVTSHFCSCDGFAHSDLYRHKATKELIDEMSLDDFRKVKIIDNN